METSAPRPPVSAFVAPGRRAAVGDVDRMCGPERGRRFQACVDRVDSDDLTTVQPGERGYDLSRHALAERRDVLTHVDVRVENGVQSDRPDVGEDAEDRVRAGRHDPIRCVCGGKLRAALVTPGPEDDVADDDPVDVGADFLHASRGVWSGEPYDDGHSLKPFGAVRVMVEVERMVSP